MKYQTSSNYSYQQPSLKQTYLHNCIHSFSPYDAHLHGVDLVSFLFNLSYFSVIVQDTTTLRLIAFIAEYFVTNIINWLTVVNTEESD